MSPSTCSLPCLRRSHQDHFPRHLDRAVGAARRRILQRRKSARPPGCRWSAFPGGFPVSPLNFPVPRDFLTAPPQHACLITLYSSWSPSTWLDFPGHPSCPPSCWGCRPAPGGSGDGSVVSSLPQTGPFSTTIWFQVLVSEARLQLYVSS